MQTIKVTIIIVLNFNRKTNMKEKEPTYFKKFKNDIETSIRELALMIKDTVATKAELQEVRDEMATKEDIKDIATKSDVKEILAHIGKYEIRAQNHEETLHQDHKPRIVDLEKKVFA